MGTTRDTDTDTATDTATDTDMDTERKRMMGIAGTDTERKRMMGITGTGTGMGTGRKRMMGITGTGTATATTEFGCLYSSVNFFFKKNTDERMRSVFRKGIVTRPHSRSPNLRKSRAFIVSGYCI